MPDATPAPEVAQEAVVDVVKTVEAKLAKGEYGKIFGAIGAMALAAVGWLNNVANNVSETKIAVGVQGTKLDALKTAADVQSLEVKNRLDRFEMRSDKLDDRMLSIERAVREVPK
jgi:hypothetical protein